MINLKIHCFGITRDILKGSIVNLELPSHSTIKELKNELAHKYPPLNQLKSLQIAVNEEYAQDHLLISESDEIVLIPPVSGG